ncbi:MAG: helix-turn-helix transcriptional regulator [Clostridia bacterium]|nr:helix-turn-helix transcriptional regulator [Clostridia bacterium]
MENDIFYLRKLKDFRKAKDITQEEMSKILHLGSTTYKNYENNITEPNIATLVKLADYFHVSLDELVGRPTNLLNKMTLTERQQTLIDKILAMNEKQQELTELYIDTMMDHIGG